MPALSRQQIRDVDRRAMEDYGISGLVLMENAGRGCADVLLRLGVRGPVTIACGKGNNAGDGFVVARFLDLQRIPVSVLLFADPAELSGDALANFKIASRSGIAMRPCWQAQESLHIPQDVDWVIDALLGTGASGPPRPPLDRAIRLLNAAGGKKLAIDLPSGLDCDSGSAAEPTFRADHTCTFVAPKIGFSNPAAAKYLGQVHVVEIGVPRKLLEEVVGI
ncbi:MAG TPA: NAD(P)H-hydrate epimerase [Pirellulaceae bacterium]|nr:NAD(P)H-hydrate epimerase [Pirellulaceae bacterium]